MQKAIKDFLNSKDYVKMGKETIWLETDSNNIPAISLYTKTGWEETAEEKAKKIFFYHPIYQK